MVMMKSGFETNVASNLRRNKIPYEYESISILYEKPSVLSRYTPDFILSNGIIIETKGLFTVKDRRKHILVRDQYPELEIRFVFQRSKNRIYPKSKINYGEWAKKEGFEFAEYKIPIKWTKEKEYTNSLRVINELKLGCTNTHMYSNGISKNGGYVNFDDQKFNFN